MIQLDSDCLMLKTASGEAIPCSAAQATLELMGKEAAQANPDLIEQAAEAVLHYFKQDLGRTWISVAEFTEALERVLRSLGFKVKASEPPGLVAAIAVSDLLQLATAAGEGFELAFFPQLREELRQQMRSIPAVLRFKNLRDGVKLLAGAKHWNSRCRELRDRVVAFLRLCLSSDAGARNQILIVH